MNTQTTAPAGVVSSTELGTSVPSFKELMTAPNAVFRGWCQGQMAYVCGDLLAAAAVCRLDDARSIMQSVLAEVEDDLSDETLEHIKRFLA
jgi:hypothetical protein